MNRSLQFWKNQKATLSSMYKRPNVEPLDAYEREEIISYFPDLQGKTVLELASGIGRFTRYFSSKAGCLISVDVTPQFVEKNRADHIDCTNVTFLCSNALDFNTEECSLDFVFANWLLMYLDDHETELLIDRIHTWLKPRGELFFRETCGIVRSTNTQIGYYVHHRPLSYYDSLIKDRFDLVKEGHIKAHVEYFADPLQNYWHCKKANKTT